MEPLLDPFYSLAGVAQRMMQDPPAKSKFLRLCAVCGHHEIFPLARRSDDVQVLRCTQCGMGVIDIIPDNIETFYEDDYYGKNEPGSTEENLHGYADYAYTVEHGVGWATALVKLLRPGGGRVLDIGCAKGELLTKLGPGYTLFGIEANEAAGRMAAKSGVTMLGQDLLDPALIESHAASFDVITAIAVFEHLRDIHKGMQAALHLLRDDGVLIFEVPLMSAVHDNTVWLTSSLEHIWYPSEQALRHLIETELGAELVGAEVFITGYASTFIGLVFGKVADGQAIRELAARVLLRYAEPSSADEAVARMLLHLVHAATATHDDIGVLATLPSTLINPQLMRRFAEQWQADLWRLGLARAEIQHADLASAAFEQRLVAADHAIVDLKHQLADAEARATMATNQARHWKSMTDRLKRRRWRNRIRRYGARLWETLTRREARKLEFKFDRPKRWLTGQREIMIRGFCRSIAGDSIEGIRFVTVGIFNRRVVGAASEMPQSEELTSKHDLSAAARFDFRVVAKLRRGPNLIFIQSRVHGEWITFMRKIAWRSMQSPSKKPITILGGKLVEGQPLVSVIIPCFNYGHYVTAAIDSVLAQTLKNIEVIVVDGGSTDGTTIKTLKGIKRERTRILFREGRHLVGSNRNFGIERANGLHICCLDADDTIDPTYIEKAVFNIETYGYDVVSTSLRFVGAKTGYCNILEFPDLAEMTSSNNVFTCAVLRKSLWEKVGGYFDTGLGELHVFEDWDFFLRVAAGGARIRNISREYLFNYRIHDSPSLSTAPDIMPLEFHRNSILNRNKKILSDSAFELSRTRRSQILRCDPSKTALVQGFGRISSQSKKTILLAMPFTIVGGAERLLSGLCGYLVRRGWSVIVLTTLSQKPELGNSVDWFKSCTDHVYALPSFLDQSEWTDFLNYLLVSRKPDCLLIAGSKWMYEQLPWIKKKYSNLSVVDLLFNTVGHVQSHQEFRSYFSFALAENKEVHEWFLNVMNWPGDRVRTVLSGVDLKRYRPDPRPKRLVDQYRIAKDDLVIGFSGRHSEEKGPDVFVEIAKLCQGIPNLCFLMTGSGPMCEVISKQVSALPDSVNFQLLGLVDNVDEHLVLYDVLLLPSRVDGRPLVVMEALASGVTVLASDVGGLTDLIEDGINGYLLPAADAKAFASAIRILAENRPLLEDLKTHARQSAEKNLDDNQSYENYEKALHDSIKINTMARA